MGSGRFDNDTLDKYYSTARTFGSLGVEQVFKQRYIKSEFDPLNIRLRESRDSSDNPLSTPLIFALDVTGSMGRIAHEIASSGLGHLMKGILTDKPVTNPHIMFMGTGDHECDSSPIQVSQFEADMRIVSDLTSLYIEGGGGGNGKESYDMAWYFAANYISTDSFEKRGKKGYLFTFGDEGTPIGLSPNDIRRFFHSKQLMMNTSEISSDVYLSPVELLRQAHEQWDVFHIIISDTGYVRDNPNVVSQWKSLMGNRAIVLKDYTKLPEVVLATIALNEKSKTLNNIIAQSTCPDVLRVAFS